MRPFLIALQFLTVIPIRLKGNVLDEERQHAVLWFPVVGLALGLLLVGFYTFCLYLFPSTLTETLTLLVFIILTGGLHWDGLADLFDGLGARRSREETLIIMRDSRLGTMGALALFMVLALKIIAFHLLPDHKSMILLYMPMMGRWVQVFLLCFGSYARAEGLGVSFFQKTRLKSFVLGSLIPIFFLVQGFRVVGVLMMLLTLFCSFLYMVWLQRRLGGQTGDTLGAATELTEVFFLLLIMLFVQWGWLWPHGLL